MSATRRLLGHLSLALLALAASARVSAQEADSTTSSTFGVFVRGTRVGSETVSVTRSVAGWQISASSALSAPFNQTTNRMEIKYGADWQPQQLAMDGSLRGQSMSLFTTFGLTTAMTDVLQGTARSSNSQALMPRAIVIAPNVFGSYEALATRLVTAAPGTSLPVFVAAQGQGTVTVNSIGPRRVTLPGGAVDIREFMVTLMGPSGTTPLEVWVDGLGHLARLTLPVSSVVVIRSDIGSVMAREERSRNPGDETLFVPANGFSLGATVTRPSTPSLSRNGRAPAVILASAPGAQDRDYSAFGVAIFTQLAGALADAGYFVVRYDSRGTGQSGGRFESAGLAEYAEDVLAAVTWLRKRTDIDADRIAVAGYDKAGPIAMLAARDKNVRALALIASPGKVGRDFAMDEQRLMLAHLDLSDTEKAKRVALQQQIIQTATSGKGWEALSPELRQQADTPWFKTWLQFDPSATLKKTDDPILVIHGALDQEVAPENADLLEQLAKTRSKLPASHARKTTITAVNHLLVAAGTGEVREYPSLENRQVSAEVTRPLVDWLATALPAR